MKKIVSIGSCFCLILLMGVGIWHTQNSTPMNALPHTGIDDEGGGVPSNLTTPNSNSEQAVLLFAQQDIIAELQKDISERDLQMWDEDSALSIDFEYVLPVYAPDHIATDSTNLSDTLVFINEYKAPAISNGVCIGTFTLVQHESKWTISMLEVGFDLEAAIMLYKDNATCFLSIAQLGTEYGFLTVSDAGETYASITHNCQEAKTGADLLTLLKSKASSNSIDDEG